MSELPRPDGPSMNLLVSTWGTDGPRVGWLRDRLRRWADRKTHALEIDWHAFGRTKGCWTDGGYGLYPRGITYDSRIGIRVSAAFTVTPTWRWDPWGDYWPPIDASLMDLIPVVHASRGGIRYLTPPKETP